jgi:CAAX prenyl protease-like protein
LEGNEAVRAEGPEAPAESRAWLSYVAPMAAFMVITALEGSLPKQYVWVYIAKAILVTALLIAGRATWKAEIRPTLPMLLLGTVVGLICFAGWVTIDPLTPHFKFMGVRTAYNPFKEIADPTVRALFLAVRFYGLVLVVPVMEELFWRSFLLRWITDQDFEKLPVGTFSWGAFAIVAAGFGLAHPEWLVAILFACAMALLLRQTRSLFACIVAHSVTNLALGIFVLTTGKWLYW